MDHSEEDRRTFLTRPVVWAGRVGVLAGFGYGFARLRAHGEPPSGARGALGILRPPGSLAESDFLAACIRCTRCTDACPPGCIALFGSEGGASQGTPYIVSLERACTMCMKCGEACPTGAIVELAEMEEAHMGEAIVDERLCVSHNGTGVCGACHTACPLKNRAITQDFRNAPVVHPEHCTGCGLCEEACIVDERSDLRAIQVVTTRRWATGVAG